MVTKCIFISHSSKESETADFLELLLTQLKEESFDVLIDKRLNPGDNWKYEIYNWMGSCHGALILLSKNAIENSMWVLREVNNLLWRRTLNSNFILIPIYFGVTPEDIKKNKLFDDLDLEKYHGPIYGNSEDSIQVIKAELVEKLQQNLITTPLDEVASLIATKLEGLSREENRRIEIIDNKLDKLNIEIEPCLSNRDPCLVLATKMLNLGLYESVKILDCFRDYLDFKDVKQIFDLLAPSWVDLRTATCVSKCALCEEHKTIVVLNSSEFFSADMYVRRASNRPPKSWLIHHFSGVYGADPAADIVTEIETVLIKELVSDEFDISESEKRQKLKGVLKKRNKDRKPVFIVLHCKEKENIAQLLPELQSVLPFVTFFLLVGQNFHENKELKGLRFKFLKPRLDPKAEKQAKDEYYDAYGMIV